MSSYAISDIHGCCKTFDRLLDKIGINRSDKLFLLGDYIDRGPQSWEVIQIILDLIDAGHYVRCLKGNHEDMMLDALEHKSDIMNVWLRNGGYEMLESYELTPRTLKNIDRSHLKFYRSLEYYVRFKDKLLVHAGFNFAKRDIFKDKEAMLWIRDWHEYYDPKKARDRQIIHGHTPTDRYYIEKHVNESVDSIVIDNGCCYTHRKGMGSLCALELGKMQLTFQRCID